MDGTLTLNQVVGHNVKRLRQKGSRPGGHQAYISATQLAKMMSLLLKEPYTRFVIADIEGRRERNVRWPELVALCKLFDVPLWELVLPVEGKGWPTPERLKLEWIEFPEDLDRRDGLAILLFGLDFEALMSKGLAHLRSNLNRERLEQLEAVTAEAMAAYEKFVNVLNAQAETEET